MKSNPLPPVFPVLEEESDDAGNGKRNEIIRRSSSRNERNVPHPHTNPSIINTIMGEAAAGPNFRSNVSSKLRIQDELAGNENPKDL